MESLVIEYNLVGECLIDVDKICKKWNHLYLVYKYDNTYKFIKYVRKDSQLRDVKVEISQRQANELIERMELVATPHPIFKKAITFRPVDN